MDDERTLLEDLGLAAVFGLILAVFYLWLFGGLWASWAAGVAYFLCVVAHARLFDARGHLATVIGAAIAGAVAGLTWWMVADIDTSWWVASAFGAALTFADVGLWEWREWKIEREAVPYESPQAEAGHGAV